MGALKPVDVREEPSSTLSAPRGHAVGIASLWRSERTRSLLLIGLVVILANGTYLLHVFNPNPINQVSGLGTISQPGLLTGGDNIDPNIGFTAQALGHLSAVDWLHGHIPWWNPYEGLGAPLAAEMQASALFPLNAFNLLPNGQVYFRLTLEILAGVGTYLLVRRFTRSNLPALVSGIAFALNGTFSWLFHAPGNPIAFMPLMLLGVEWAREGAMNGVRRGWALMATAFALSLYAGFPEVAFIDGLLVGLWFIVRAATLPRRFFRVFAQSAALGAVVGGLLAAPIMVAFVDYLPYADIGGHAGAFARASLSATTALPAQIMPYVFGPIFGFTAKDPAALTPFWGNIGGYLGASLCILAVIGVAGRTNRTLRVVLALWVLVGLARLVGVGWALDLVNAIPGVKSTAFYRYAPPSWELALIVLAAFGLDEVINRLTPRRVIVGGGVVMVGLCLLCWHTAQPVFDALAGQPHHRAWALASLIWALIVVIGVMVLSVLRVSWSDESRLTAFVPPVLAALVVLDVMLMFVVPQLSAPRQATIDMGPVTYLERHLGQSRFFTLGPLAPNYGSYFGLDSVAVNDVPIPKTYETFILNHLDTNVDPLIFTGTTMQDPTGPTPAYEFLAHLSQYESIGVKYLLIPQGEELPVVGGYRLRQVFSDATTRIVELPRPAPLFASMGGPCSVRAESETVVSVDCGRPTTIVYRELYMPGWHAEARGRPLDVRRAGPIFQSVVVPAGSSTVTFDFTPPHVGLALVAFALGLGLLVLAFLRVRSLRVPARHTPP